jgi:hypothetical protein
MARMIVVGLRRVVPKDVGERISAIAGFWEESGFGRGVRAPFFP